MALPISKVAYITMAWVNNFQCSHLEATKQVDGTAHTMLGGMTKGLDS